MITARVSMLLKSRASLTCFQACFLPGRAKDLSAPRYVSYILNVVICCDFRSKYSNIVFVILYSFLLKWAPKIVWTSGRKKLCNRPCQIWLWCSNHGRYSAACIRRTYWRRNSSIEVFENHWNVSNLGGGQKQVEIACCTPWSIVSPSVKKSYPPPVQSELSLQRV